MATIILVHGILGVGSELFPSHALPIRPVVDYFNGVKAHLEKSGIGVMAPTTAPLQAIEDRGKELAQSLDNLPAGRVDIIAHSMGGLDARYMISQLRPANVKVLSLTTIATPHRGSAFADYCFEEIPKSYLPHFYKFFANMGISTGAFSQLTTSYMAEDFNPRTPDVEGVQYYSYGATFTPTLLSAFRIPFRVVEKREGANDGLVSVESAKWGTYKGTLVEVSHLDLINWTNRLKWYFWQLGGYEKK
jgi:triacylglycerol lipase